MLIRFNISLLVFVYIFTTIIFYTTFPLWVAGGLEPIPPNIWQEAGYFLNKFPVYHRANTERFTLTFTPI